MKAEVTTPHFTYVQPLMRYGAPTFIIKFLGVQDKVYDEPWPITALVCGRESLSQFAWKIS